MSGSPRFANYPKACEGPATPYKKEVDHNPILRGWPLILASNLIASSSAISWFFWKNARFRIIRDIPGLNEYAYRYNPTVIPIADKEEVAEAQIGPELYERQALDLRGRYYSVADYHELYKTRQITPLQVAEALLPLIRRDTTPPGKYSSAFLECDAERVLAAAKASTERYAAGHPLGILDGVPIGVKEHVDVKGYTEHMGMRYDPTCPFFKPAEKTEKPVQHLLDAGAIMVGKQMMTKLGMETSGQNPRLGTPVNWYNTMYYPGGSSSGAGSSIGAGIVPISVGTDAGGSCRHPAAYGGLYALKTSQHRICAMRCTVCVTGPMASTVADLTVAYRLMAQPDPEDPIQSLFSHSIPPVSTSGKKTLGIYRDWFNDADANVIETCEKAIDYLRSHHGYEVIDITIPYVSEGRIAHGNICISESADEARMRTSKPADYMSILNHPNKVLMAVGSMTPMIDYAKMNQLRDLHMQHLAFLFKQYPGLLIVTPTIPFAGWKGNPRDAAYGFSDTNMTLKSMRYVWLANWTGCPAVVAPVGYVDPEIGEGKLPISMMAMGEWGAEEQLLGWARDVEMYLNESPEGRLKPKEWADVIELAKAKNTA